MRKVFIPVFLLLCGLSGGFLFFSCGKDQPPKTPEQPGSVESSAETAIQLPESRLFSFTFAGDLMAHNVNYQMNDYREIYRRIRHELSEDDLSFVNLETPVHTGRDYQTYPLFNIREEYLNAAVQAGFDVFSLANNHSLDQGRSGVHATRGVFEDLASGTGPAGGTGLWWSGLRGEDDLSFEPESIELEGLRLGFLAVSGITNEIEGKELLYLVPEGDPEAKQRFLSMLERVAGRFDLFILSFHGGREYVHQPVSEKRDFLLQCAEAGADIVWAHHPHVLQPWYLVETSRGSSLIMYSAGNFISGQTWLTGPQDYTSARASTGESALFRVVVAETRRGTEITSVRPLFIGNYREPGVGMTVWPFSRLVSEEMPKKWQKYFQYRKTHVEQFQGVPVWRRKRAVLHCQF